jgi:cytochrome c-type biogenesis protein CcmE
MVAPGGRLGWAMWTVGDVIEGILRFVRESWAPLVAALWALAAVVLAPFLIRWWQDNLLWQNHLALKLGASLLAVGGAAGSLLWWSLQPSAQYYLFVDEAVVSAHALHLRGVPTVRVHGCVVPDSIERRAGTDEYRFRLASRYDRPPAVLEAHYTGVLPDGFRSAIELVANGTLTADGRRLDIASDGIWMRCPGKYDPSSPPPWECPKPGS